MLSSQSIDFMGSFAISLVCVVVCRKSPDLTAPHKEFVGFIQNIFLPKEKLGIVRF